ncbi:MAG: TRAP transporter TatT component family protein [Treponema sp.]|nr:TRAP transporter TatT component family protein [Treponema sp.]MCL2252049.1 TRAP transporter TatT component family protein [Treponema sp.]
MKTRIIFTSFALFFAISFMSCSINKMAMNLIADALTGEGSSDVFTGDGDPQLVGDAIPFAIKMYEALLDQNPDHYGLSNTTGSMFVMYANAFVQGPAEMLPTTKYQEKQEAINRARNLYLRGLTILYNGLDLKYPGFSSSFKDGRLPEILAKMKKRDVPALYWSAAAGLSAFSLNPFDLDLGMRIVEFHSLVERAYELDPDFNYGALDEFLLLFHASIPSGMGGDITKAETYFQRALEKTSGNSAGTYVAYAQSVCIPAQNYNLFKELLEKALAIDVNKNPSTRLVNIISQKKARFLLDSASRFFFALDDDDWDDNW